MMRGYGRKLVAWCSACGLAAGFAVAQETAPRAITPPFSPTLEIDVPAPPEEVWEALTQPKHLERWFSRQAALQPRLGGQFRWSHSTERLEKPARKKGERKRREALEAATATEEKPRRKGKNAGKPRREKPRKEVQQPTAAKPQPPQFETARITGWQPGRLLEYDWALGRIPTRVEWQLSPATPVNRKQPVTRVRVSHLILGNTSDRVSYFRNPLLYLRVYMADGKVPLRYADEAKLSDGGLVLEMPIEASQQRVWAALTKPDVMQMYQPGSPQVDLRVGGNVRYGWGEEGQITAFKAPQLLQHKFTGNSLLTWEISKRGKGAKVRIEQSDMSKNDKPAAAVPLWSEVLHQLKYAMETDRPVDLAVRP